MWRTDSAELDTVLIGVANGWVALFPGVGYSSEGSVDEAVWWQIEGRRAPLRALETFGQPRLPLDVRS